MANDDHAAPSWRLYLEAAAADGVSRGAAARGCWLGDGPTTEPLPVAELAAAPLEPVRVWDKLRRPVRWSK